MNHQFITFIKINLHLHTPRYYNVMVCMKRRYEEIQRMEIEMEPEIFMSCRPINFGHRPKYTCVALLRMRTKSHYTAVSYLWRPLPYNKPSTMSCFVEPLAALCKNYIVEHLEEFPISHLSLLPLSMRRDLLWRLPIADVCLRLEGTDFIKGLDMAAYWKLPCENPVADVEYTEDSDIKQYVAERWPNEVEYSKAWLYGRVAACEIGCLGDSHEFVFPENESASCDALSFLYSVRMLHGDRLTYPPRYQRIEKLPSWPHLTKKQEQDIIDAIVSAFNGERPKMLPEAQVLASLLYTCRENGHSKETI